MLRHVMFGVFLSVVLVGCGQESSSKGSRQAAAPAQQAPLALTGRVLQDGEPVERAALVVASVETGLVPEGFDPASMFTDEAGAFRIELDPGSYRVIVVGPDRSQVEATVELTPDLVPLELNLVAQPEPERDFVENGPRFERSEDVR